MTRWWKVVVNCHCCHYRLRGLVMPTSHLAFSAWALKRSLCPLVNRSQLLHSFSNFFLGLFFSSLCWFWNQRLNTYKCIIQCCAHRKRRIDNMNFFFLTFGPIDKLSYPRCPHHLGDALHLGVEDHPSFAQHHQPAAPSHLIDPPSPQDRSQCLFYFLPQEKVGRASFTVNFIVTLARLITTLLSSPTSSS